MKIVETLEISNPEKVFMGDKHVKLTLDTNTGRVGIDTPAMFTDPLVPLETLMGKLEKLWQLAHPDEVYDRSGMAHVHGRCDACGARCDEEGCIADRSHNVAKA